MIIRYRVVRVKPVATLEMENVAFPQYNLPGGSL